MRKKLLSTYGIKDVSPYIQSLPQLESPLICKVCFAEFTSNLEYAYHSIEHSSNKMYQCHLCDFTDVRGPRFKGHMRAHDKIREFKCPTCHQQFYRLRKTIEHSLTHERKRVNDEKRHELLSNGDSADIVPRKRRRSKNAVLNELLSKIDAADVVPLVDLLVPLKCAECDKIFTNNLDYGFHSRKHSKLRLYQCHLCNFQVKQSGTFETHIRNHEGSKKYKCTICSQQYSRIVGMVNHKLVHAKENTIKCQMNLTTREIKLFSKYNIKNPESFTVYPGELEIPLKCHTCEELFSNNVDFALHSREHNLHGILTCHICDYKDSDKQLFELHVRDHEGIKRFKCPTCNEQFSAILNAIEHKNSHEGKTNSECDVCGKKFVKISHLNHHRHREHISRSIKILSCDYCKKNFSDSVKLQRHIFQYHKNKCERQCYLCDICGRSFFFQSELRSHKVIHDGIKKFACKKCPKKFSCGTGLKSHQRVHSDKKEYTCSYCGKQFVFVSGLSYHLKLHTGEKPYSCLSCDRKFVSSGNMRLHMKRMHSKK